MDVQAMARAINTLADFLGMRDAEELTPSALLSCLGRPQADVMVLFGGSILCGVDVLAQAMRGGVAKKYVIVGGEGHTTEALRQRVHSEFPDVETAGLPEAQVFVRALMRQYGLTADLLECNSTNCGNNITYLLEMLQENDVDCGSVILTQDASMQRRMAAGLRKYAPDVRIVNYASYRAQVVARDGALAYAQPIRGMWDMERYISLLLGEIPRLTDDAQGYGPRGKGFIAHVDVPENVRAAFDCLRGRYAHLVRGANPAYA